MFIYSILLMYLLVKKIIEKKLFFMESVLDIHYIEWYIINVKLTFHNNKKE